MTNLLGGLVDLLFALIVISSVELLFFTVVLLSSFFEAPFIVFGVAVSSSYLLFIAIILARSAEFVD
jgi:hypothetical protein